MELHASQNLAVTFITLGALFLAGLGTDLLGRLTRLPRVTLLLLFGFLIGPGAFDLLPDITGAWFNAITNIALVMVGFLLGEKLTLRHMRRNGSLVLTVSLSVALVTAMVVGAGLWLVGAPTELALLLAGVAVATDPAATVDVIRENRAGGPFSETLLDVVAIDDVWGVLLFSVVLILAQLSAGVDGIAEAAAFGLSDLGGSVAIGLALGLPMAALTGRVSDGEPTLVEALGFVFLCTGLAVWSEVSFLIAAMVMGATVANVARHHKYPFHAIEGIEWPFLILFFLLAGASLEPAALLASGLFGLVFLVLRLAGRLAGGWLGSSLAGGGPVLRRWVGVALLPQAGVAIGLALVAVQTFPALAETLLPITIGATVVFELTGPIITRMALNAADELGRGGADGDAKDAG